MIKAQSKQGAENTTNITQSFGFLTWWTIRQAIYQTDELKRLGLGIGIPDIILNTLTGAEPKTAWLKATGMLGSHGQRSESLSDDDYEMRYLVKDVGQEARALVVQVVDKSGKKISTSQIATLGRDGDYITADLFKSPYLNQDEAVNLIYAMQEEMTRRIGQVDDTRIRSGILRWLEVSHRVAVRGSGGVYFIPTGKNNAGEKEKEILAVRHWLDQTLAGTLSVIQLTDDGVTTVTDFREAAVTEIHAEIQNIMDVLRDLENNTESSPGRLLQTSTVQSQRVNELAEKINALDESLGEIIGTVKGAFAVVKNKASKLNSEHHNLVSMVGPGSSSNQTKKSATTGDRSRKI